jgi:hypothetical protein
VSRTRFKGGEYLDIRLYFKGKDGEFKPTRKGITFKIARLPEVMAALKTLGEGVGAELEDEPEGETVEA